MNRFCFTVLIFICSSIALPSRAKEIPATPSRTVTKQAIVESKEKFSEFLSQKQKEYAQLEYWTNPNSFFGSLIASAIETFSPWTRYGQIEPEKTKAFLGRAFSKPKALQDAIDTLAQSNENLEYLNLVLGEMSEEDMRKKNLGRLAEAMKGKHHPGIPETEHMDSKNERGEYVVPEKDFYLFAATNLFAVFCVEEEQLVTQHRGRHPHGRPGRTTT